MSLCQYKNFFGAPRTGIHADRIPVLDWALWDTVLTVAAGVAIAKYTEKDWKPVTFKLFVAGFILHKVFCVK